MIKKQKPQIQKSTSEHEASTTAKPEKDSRFAAAPELNFAVGFNATGKQSLFARMSPTKASIVGGSNALAGTQASTAAVQTTAGLGAEPGNFAKTASNMPPPGTSSTTGGGQGTR